MKFPYCAVKLWAITRCLLINLLKIHNAQKLFQTSKWVVENAKEMLEITHTSREREAMASEGVMG